MLMEMNEIGYKEKSRGRSLERLQFDVAINQSLNLRLLMA